MSKNDHYETKAFFKQYVAPLLNEQKMTLKEFSRGVGMDPKNLAKYENGILVARGNERKKITKFIETFRNKPIFVQTEEPVPTPVEPENKPISPLPTPTMPEMTPSLTRDLTRKLMREHNLDTKDLAELLEVSKQTIYNFMQGKNMWQKNLDKLNDILKDEGLVSRLGLPHDLGQPVKADMNDKMMLAAIGFRDTRGEDGSTYEKAHPAQMHEALRVKALTNLEKMIVVAAVMQAPAGMSLEDKAIILQKLFPEEYPVKS